MAASENMVEMSQRAEAIGLRWRMHNVAESTAMPAKM
jgi:hypothetical protein